MSRDVHNSGSAIRAASNGATEVAPGVATARGDGAHGADATDALLAREQLHSSTLYAQRSAFVRGGGSFLYDADGRQYLDFMTGIGVASLGHAHPGLARAIAQQAETLIVCPQSQGNDVRARLLERLTAMAGAPLSRVFLSNSGGEANEAAVKWARAATGRKRVIAAKRGFAGRSLGALALTWEPSYRLPFEPLPGPVEFVSYGDLPALERVLDDSVAAFIVEPIQGEGGLHPAPDGYLQGARELTARHGTLLVLDEVQCGAGRTGTFLAAHSSGVQPDMVTLAKGLAGGVPIGATLMTDQVASAMPRGGHGSTFGGNPLACAAALAVLGELESGSLLVNVETMGERLLRGLAEIESTRIREIRGRGLMVGVDLRERAAPVIASLKNRGLLTIAAGATVIRLLPPLNVSAAEVDRAVELLRLELATGAKTSFLSE